MYAQQLGGTRRASCEIAAAIAVDPSSTAPRTFVSLRFVLSDFERSRARDSSHFGQAFYSCLTAHQQHRGVSFCLKNHQHQRRSAFRRCKRGRCRRLRRTLCVMADGAYATDLKRQYGRAGQGDKMRGKLQCEIDPRRSDSDVSIRLSIPHSHDYGLQRIGIDICMIRTMAWQKLCGMVVYLYSTNLHLDIPRVNFRYIGIANRQSFGRVQRHRANMKSLLYT